MDEDFLNPAVLDRADQLAHKAVQLDANLPQAHAQLGYVLISKRQHDDSIAEFERAIALNPNFTDWRFAASLVYAGQSERAIQVGKAHMRLDPFYPPVASGFLGLAYYMLKRYSEALPRLRECASRALNQRAGHAWLAATYGQLAQSVEAQTEVSEVLRIEPNYTIDGTERRIRPFKLQNDADHYFDGLRKAGLP